MRIQIKKKIKIIPIEIKHAERLAEIHIRSWQEAYKNFISDTILNSLSIKQREQHFVSAIKNKTESTYVSLYEDIPVGFVTFGKCRDTDIEDECGEIWGIYLDPKYWRRGIGTKLAVWASDCLVKSGFKKIYLWVFENNLSSRRFYESIGFKLEGSKKILEKYDTAAIRYLKEI